MKQIFVLFLALFFSFISFLPLRAQMVVSLNLEQLTALSERAFVGQCLSVKNIKDEEGKTVQEITFQVTDSLKGDPTPTVTFRQLSATTQEIRGPQGQRMTVQSPFNNLPTYRVGEESIIFLSADGPAGLTAPIGLSQGKFKVETLAGGQKLVVNSKGNKGLFSGGSGKTLQALSLSSKEIPYSEFVSMVKKIADSQTN